MQPNPQPGTISYKPISKHVRNILRYVVGLAAVICLIYLSLINQLFISNLFFIYQ